MAYDALFEAAGKQYNVDPALLKIVSGTESNGNINAVSPKGAAGLMQLMPGTAEEMGFPDYKTNVASNIYGGAKYLSQQLDRYGSVPLALAAYNAGPDAVDKHGGIPPYPETQNYVAKNMNAYTSPRSKAPADLPGLPPIAPSADGVDPFAGLDNAAGSAAPKSNVDPFAGLENVKSSMAPVSASAPKGGASTIPGAPPKAAPAPAAAPESTASMLYRGLNLLNPAGAALNAFGSGDPTKDFTNLLGGAARGAGTIGNTILSAADTVLPINNLLGTTSDERKAGMDAGLKSLGADPSSGLFGLGKIGAEVAGTSGAGPLIGAGLKALPLVGGALGPLSTAISSGGLSTGLAPSGFLATAGNAALRGIGGAASGAAQTALVAPESIGKVAAFGAAVPLGAAAIGGVGKSLYNTALPLVNPSAYVGKGIAGSMSPEEAATAAANIANARTLVPGSTPTAAQVAGSPSILMAERAATNRPGAVKAAQTANIIANNDARWNALEGVAGTASDLAAARAARTAGTQPLYAKAHAATGTIDQDLLDTASRPAVMKAMQQADTLAKNEGVQLQWPTPDNPIISGHALDYTNRALKDMIGAAKRDGKAELVNALEDAQGHIRTWADANIPEVAAASNAYSKASVPVNTMKAAQQVAATLGGKPAMISGVAGQPSTAILGLGPYSSALTKALKDVKYPIDPAAGGVLQSVAEDLQRASVSNSLPKNGSGTAYDLGADGWLARQVYGNKFQGASSLGRLTAMLVGAAGAGKTGLGPLATLSGLAGGYGAASKLGKFVGGRLDSALAEHLINNPSALAPFLNARASIGSNVTPALFSSAARAAPLALVNGTGTSGS